MRLRGLTRKILILGAGLALLSGTAALTAGVGFTDARMLNAKVVLAKGAIHLSNSRAGKSILMGLNMLPGQLVRGWAKIGNPTKLQLAVTLGKSRLIEDAGVYGGRLSQRLLLKVEWIQNGKRPIPEYWGMLSKMRTVKLGVFKPREVRWYLLTAYFPDGGPSVGTAGDNAYMGADLTVQFDWTATLAPKAKGKK
jgi:hypothetical protein